MNDPLQLVVRQAQPSDASRLSVLAIHVWIDTYAHQGVSDVIADYVSAAFSPAAFANRIADPALDVMVAQVDQNLVGLMAVRHENPFLHASAELETLYVVASLHRRGIGRALLAAARGLIRKRCRDDAFWLSVNSQNSKAIGFYREQGLGEAGKTYFELGGQKYENLMMISRSSPMSSTRAQV